jgi:very-short-patch-repair endonuclease
MAKELIRKYPDLVSFTRANYENIIQRFVDIDKSLSRRWQERIAYNVSLRKIPRGVGSGYVSEYTELNLLLKEIQKRKRHIPIRQLVKRAGNALQGLKPCFMMSPMSVAQYLEPGKIEFDMVIMDEASQIRPAEAIAAIARSNQFVIVGDPNQLPPTSFFQRTGGEDYGEEETTAVEDMESILDICLANYQKRRLRWHYRSEHESLIAFSNNQFYDDDLIVFPAPHKDDDNNGIHYHYIKEAKYQKGRNRVEAQSVTDAIVEHFRNRPHLSLGVATFNREQAELIQDTLERRQKELAWIDAKVKDLEESTEPFFIKNLENVQGDERDVIFISTTYGPDAQTGIVYQRFGPISADTGWRRLNVIVSRARKRLEIFASMHATDIKLSLTPSRGVQALKAYLEYAETGNLPNPVGISGREPGSDFEIAVSRILLSNGYKIEPQVGVAGFFIDIGVKNPEREDEFICGIECDGASYHSAKSVRDRDRLRQEILVRKGWNIHRIWSTDWFKNREREVQRLLNHLGEILNTERTRVSVIHKKEKESEKEIRKGKIEEYRDRMDLRELLIKYNETNIVPRYPDHDKGILRKEMLNCFVMSKPLTREEFYKCIPLALRQHTDGQQMQFLEDIFDIIDDYISQ